MKAKQYELAPEEKKLPATLMRANGTASDVRFCYRFREKASPPQFGKIILAMEEIRSFPQTVAKGCWGCC